MLEELGSGDDVILSTEQHPVVRARAEKLRVAVRHGVAEKAAVLREWAASEGVPLDEIAYLGNDVNDLPAMAIVGWPVAVADARPEVIAAFTAAEIMATLLASHPAHATA